jgi:ATP-binding cassette subfamily F protein 3
MLDWSVDQNKYPVLIRVPAGQVISTGKEDNTDYSKLNKFSLMENGEKVALIGANGTGKTTILKILNKIIPADAGLVKLGTNVTLCYYDQEMAVLDSSNTLFDEISNMRPEMTNTEIRNLLAAFLFKEDDVFKTVSSLSGGEKGRLSLAKLMLSNANFLVLDEPTNHLDILSKDILENAINAYTGTVLYVSHDRYFINKTATRILSLNDNQLYNYIGNYDYYLEKKTSVENPVYATSDTSNKDTSVAATGTNYNHSTYVDATANISDNKLSWQQAKEQQAKERKRKNSLNKIENEIASIETRINELDEEIAKPEIASDIAKLLPLSKEKEELDEKLMELMETWEELSLEE